MAKSATIGAVAVAAAVALVVYLALASSATAQTASTTSTSTSSQTTTQPGSPSNWPQIWRGNSQGGQDTPFQLGGGAPPGQWIQQGGGGGWFGPSQSEVNLTVGQTITITSTTGEYRTTGTSSSNGTASGTITFKVTGELSQGYTLTVTSGSLTVAGTTYTIESGSAQMDQSGTMISGQGTLSPSGSFILHASAHGTFVGTSASMSLDFTNGTTEYLVSLTGST